jgi:hypothetical protein
MWAAWMTFFFKKNLSAVFWFCLRRCWSRHNISPLKIFSLPPIIFLFGENFLAFFWTLKCLARQNTHRPPPSSIKNLRLLLSFPSSINARAPRQYFSQPSCKALSKPSPFHAPLRALMRVESSGGLPLPELERQQAGAKRRRRRARAAAAAAAPRTMAAPATAVQRLFEACREVFTGAGPGAVPPPAGVERIKSVLGN